MDSLYRALVHADVPEARRTVIGAVWYSSTHRPRRGWWMCRCGGN